MSRRCSVCRHEWRSEIELALALGASLRDVAGRYGLSASAVHRHWRKHPVTDASQPWVRPLEEFAERLEKVEKLNLGLAEGLVALAGEIDRLQGLIYERTQ